MQAPLLAPRPAVEMDRDIALLARCPAPVRLLGAIGVERSPPGAGAAEPSAAKYSLTVQQIETVNRNRAYPFRGHPAPMLFPYSRHS